MSVLSQVALLYELLQDLPLHVESWELEPRSRAVSSAFTRQTTIVRLRGAGEEGVGEDVTYDGRAHDALQQEGLPHGLAGNHTLDSFSVLLDTLEPVAVGYRRWGLESAALDLALRQAGRPLHDVVGREPKPVRFVVSLRLPDPPSVEPLVRLREREPTLRFKLDPTSDWTDRLVDELVALDCVDVVDLKGAYRGTVVDQPADARLYRLVAEAFPNAWIEDPNLDDPEAAAALAGHRDRITWDAVIHSVADVDALPFPPRTLNVKPSRFGTLRRLFDFYDACEERDIGLYGGGQFELGPGRAHVQYLASLFCPDAPNDVAPGGYNDPDPEPGLPGSPLGPPEVVAGFTAQAYGREFR
jgi:L-alanine-DL-glutamate epimerase-like enolase superfamily enzyme